MNRRSSNPSKSPKKMIIGLLIVLIVGAGLTIYLSTRHYQIRYVTRHFMYYEQSGDFGTAWSMLHSLEKTNMNQATYVKTKSQIYLEDFKASSYSYKIKRIRHLNTWHLTKSLTFHNVYRVTIDQSFKSQFGPKIMISEIYVARDKKEQNRWTILWE